MRKKIKALSITFLLSLAAMLTQFNANVNAQEPAPVEQTSEETTDAQAAVPGEEAPAAGVPEEQTEAPMTEIPATEAPQEMETPQEIPPVTEQMAEYSEERVSDTGTLQIMYGYAFSDGSYDPWISVPGAAVGKNTVITDDVFDVVRTDSPIYQKVVSERKDGYASLGVDITNLDAVKAGCVIMVYDGSSYLKHGNMQVRPTENGTNYTIITTEETLNYYGKFAASGIELGSEVYAAGFSTSMMDTSHYATEEDVLQQAVSVTGLNDDGTISFSIDSTESFCSLVNSDGEVVGIITDITSGTGRAVAAVDVESYLDEVQVKYLVGTAQDPISNVSLKNAIKDAEALNEADYTKESYDYLKQAIEKGKKVIDKTDATQSEIDTATNDIINAVNSLQETSKKMSPKVIFIIILAAIIILGGLTIVCILLLKPKDTTQIKTKNKKKPAQSNIPNIVQQAPPQEEATQYIPDYMQNAQAQTENPQGFREISRTENSNYNNAGYEAETSVLTSEAGKTLYFIREKTGEQIRMDKLPFTIGKSANADYQILDNGAVSRIHCRIAQLNNETVIFDNDSTNHTYVQGNKLGRSPYPLTGGETVVLANESFRVEYRDN